MIYEGTYFLKSLYEIMSTRAPHTDLKRACMRYEGKKISKEKSRLKKYKYWPFFRCKYTAYCLFTYRTLTDTLAIKKNQK